MAKGKFGKLVAISTVVGAGAWVYKKYDTIKSMYHKVSIFKGDRYEFDEFDGEAIAAMFSGVLIDLSDVVFNEDEVYLDIYSLCSGVKVLIPKDVEVVLEGSNVASGVQIDQDEDIVKTRTLYINYNITASGLQITDNVDDFCDDDCCSDPECKDPDCCSDDNSMVDDMEEAIEDFSEEVEPFLEETFEEVESDVEEIKEEVEEPIEEVEESIEEKVNDAATELDEAAQDVEEAIESFMDQDDAFDNFESNEDTKDDFFD